jgi:hypothetical protein
MVISETSRSSSLEESNGTKKGETGSSGAKGFDACRNARGTAAHDSYNQRH